MSALEHIRKRPALVISILGLALVLFIITAVSDNIFSFFGDRDTAVKVDGKKLKIDKLQRASHLVNNQMRAQGYEDVESSYADELALQQIINEELLDNEFEALGIKVTDEEMQGYLFGPGSLIMAEVQQRYGFDSPEAMYNFAYSNDAQAPEVRALWEDMEQRYRSMLKRAKFQGMLGAITANKLDAKAYYDDNKNVTLSAAKIDYATIGNDDYKVSDAEINDRYSKDKERYKLDNEMRRVNYIIVTPTPSPEDAAATSKEVEDAIAGLRATDGTEAIAGNFNFETNVYTGSAESLPPYIKNALERIEADGAVLISNSGYAYNIAKLLSKETGVEKADVDFYITNNEMMPIANVIDSIAAGSISSYGDSIVKINRESLKLVKGSNFAEFADKIVNAQGVNVISDEDFKAQAFTELSRELFGQQVSLSGDDLAKFDIAYVVNGKDEPTEIYEVAAITRNLVPSDATVSDMRQQLASYSATNATAESFVKNADKANFHVEEGYISPERFAVLTRNGQRIPQTVSLARWAMEDAKKGDVSDVIEAGDSFIVIAVADVYDDGYRPATDPIVKEELTAKIRADKKGNKLVADYKGKGKNVEEYAAAMNTQPVTIRANYAQNDGGVMRGDAKFLGYVGAAEKGKTVGPVATGSAAMVFEVVNVDNAGAEFDYDAVAPQAMRQFMFDVDRALRANKDIEYKALRFQSRD